MAAERLRLFVGVPLPESWQQGLQDIRAAWGRRLASKLSWTRKGNWHLTLKFLGDVEQCALDGVREALAAIAWSGYTMCAAGGGFFPPPHPKRGVRPRVVWVGLGQGAAESVRLANLVDGAMAGVGFEREKRAFTPHLTLARVKHAQLSDDREGRWQELLAELQAQQWPAYDVGCFVLWQSRLGASGPDYTRLAEFPPSS